MKHPLSPEALRLPRFLRSLARDKWCRDPVTGSVRVMKVYRAARPPSWVVRTNLDGASVESAHDPNSVVDAAHHQRAHHTKTQPLADTLPGYTNQHDEHQESAGCYPAQRGFSSQRC
jgi:hypothetical protein